MNKKNNQSGISLIEVLLAISLMVAASTMFIRMNKNQIVSQKRVEESAEILSVSNIIAQSLISTNACTETIGVGTIISESTELSSIQNITGQIIIEANQPYSNSQLIRVGKIYLSDISYGEIVAGEKKGSAFIVVEFIKSNKVVQGQSQSERGIIKRFPISFTVNEINNNNMLITCSNEDLNGTETVLNQACASIGGLFDPITNLCDLQQSSFVQKSGDEMTGSLHIQGNLNITDGNICIDSNCLNFDALNCPSGQVLTSIGSSGAPNCTNANLVLSQALCAPGTVLQVNTNNAIYCGSCSDPGPWIPDAADVCVSELNVPQINNCAQTNILEHGEKTDEHCRPECTEDDYTGWTPLASSECNGTSFQQSRSLLTSDSCINNADITLTRLELGTKQCCQLKENPIALCDGGDSEDPVYCASSCNINDVKVSESTCLARSEGPNTENSQCDCVWVSPSCYSFNTQTDCNNNSDACEWDN